MPTIELTQVPKLLSSNAKLAWWRIQIMAHSYYPDPKDARRRSKHADKILRGYAKDWTNRICPLPSAGPANQRWMALHGHCQGQDEVADLKANESRDLRIAIEVLLHCTTEGFSKAQVFKRIALDLVKRGRSNSVESAESIVKRAWSKYNAGCHFAAAELLVARTKCDKTPPEMVQYVIDVISLAEKLRAIGEETVPPHGTVPILDPKKTWRVPHFFPLSTINIVDCGDRIVFQAPG